MPLAVKPKHPLAIRWFHWINFPILSVMVWSGLLILWAQSPQFTFMGIEIPPHRFYMATGIESPDGFGRLGEGMAWHFLFMWIFAINGLLYVLYLAFSGEWRVLVPQKGTLKNAFQTVLHDLRILKQEPKHGKFNGAQQIAYTTIIVMGALAVITGIAIYKPVQATGIENLLGGYWFARTIHFLLMLGFVGFFLIHVL
jgi:thiosulfate reductase cytochrome b subunit